MLKHIFELINLGYDGLAMWLKILGCVLLAIPQHFPQS